MATILRTCPFCGKGVSEMYQINSLYAVHCDYCGATGPLDEFSSYAREKWNTRMTENTGFISEYERMAQDLLVLIDSGTNDSVSEFTQKLAIIRNRRQQEGRR